jgi:predicted short-subunit dehydrogenase-like oxidoreductase (DUF2520 family)
LRSLRFIGPGRAGRSLAAALATVGWQTVGMLSKEDQKRDAAAGVDVLVLSTPDDALAEVAAQVSPDPGCVVMHLSGAIGLDVLARHPRRAALHPLVPLPDGDSAARLLQGVTFAVDGDPVAQEMAESLGGRAVRIADEDRATYHAAACIAANHVVALLGQVERVAATVGLELQDFLSLTRAAVDDVGRLGPRRALTGPVARQDWATLVRHRSALAPEERPGYVAGVALAHRLAVDAGSGSSDLEARATRRVDAADAIETGEAPERDRHLDDLDDLDDLDEPDEAAKHGRHPGELTVMGTLR